MIGQRQGVKIRCDKFDGFTPCMGHCIGGLIGNEGNREGKIKAKCKIKRREK
jgi:hypothetical protein